MTEHAQDRYDVFLSYAEADRAWVEGYLLDGLRAAGVRCHSEASFSLGVPRLEEFERAVRQSRRTHRVIASLALGLVLVAGLAVWGGLSARQATLEAKRAREQEQAVRAERDRAEGHRRMALARQLAAQAELLRNEQPHLLGRSVLLAMESMRRLPSREAAQPLTQGSALLPRRTAPVFHGAGVAAMAFSPDGKYLATAIGSIADIVGRLTKAPTKASTRVWEVPSGRAVVFLTHERAVDAVAFSPDGKYLATGGFDRTARVWEVASGREVARMTHEDSVRSVAFSLDGKYVASASAHFLLSTHDHTARVWEAATGRELARMTHPTSVLAVAFSPDGHYLATAGFDRGVRVWELPGGRELLRVMHEENVNTLAFSPDGKFLGTASGDILSPENNRVRVWRWRPEDLITEACSRLTRNLTWEEWCQYLGDEPYRRTAGELPPHPSVVLGLVERAVTLVRGGDSEAASSNYARGGMGHADRRAFPQQLYVLEGQPQRVREAGPARRGPCGPVGPGQRGSPRYPGTGARLDGRHSRRQRRFQVLRRVVQGEGCVEGNEETGGSAEATRGLDCRTGGRPESLHSGGPGGPVG